MAKERAKRPRAGRQNAAQNRPPDATPPAGADEQKPLEVAYDPGLVDLGDDVARGAEEGGSPRLPERGTLEGGIDAGLTDLGDDVARPADLDEDERPR